MIASDVNENTVAEIMEHMDALQGVNISEDSIRYYNDSKYFASLIGYTGKISTEEYDRLTADEKNKKKYSKTDTIGKAGLEQSMDAVLKGNQRRRYYLCRQCWKNTRNSEKEQRQKQVIIFI